MLSDAPLKTLGQLLPSRKTGFSNLRNASLLTRLVQPILPTHQPVSASKRRISGASLVEVLMSISISSISIGGIFQGYLMASKRAEWLACSQAANSKVLQRIEQVRAARWDPQASPALDEVQDTNFPASVAALEIPTKAGTEVYATNTLTISTISADPPLKMVTVECTWSLGNRGPFTNSMAIYRSPDQ